MSSSNPEDGNAAAAKKGIVHDIPQRHVMGSPHAIKLHRDIVVKG